MYREKLMKLLNLSTSDQDGEALSAIRHANELLKKNNLRWEDIIFPSVKPPPSEFEDLPSVHVMFDTLFDQGCNHPFVVSLHEYFLTKGFLTKKQRQGLYKFYERAEYG